MLNKLIDEERIREDFQISRQEYKSITKWIWNTPLESITAPTIYEQLKHFRDHDGYSGVMVVLWGHDGYLSEEHFS